MWQETLVSTQISLIDTTTSMDTLNDQNTKLKGSLQFQDNQAEHHADSQQIVSDEARPYEKPIEQVNLMFLQEAS